MYKVDLHTHSEASPDGSITADQYRAVIEKRQLDCIAVTDHDRIDFAVELHKELGEKIIVGEEITAKEGEIIGLYLKKKVEPHQTALQTAKAIKAQGGIVYIPHPFETTRKGLQQTTLDEIKEYVDLLEVHNGRAFFQDRSKKALLWATVNGVPWAASSDAHGVKGLGTTCTVLADMPTRDIIVDLNAKGQAEVARPPLTTLLYPKFNRLRKKLPKGKVSG